ncbi:MAG: AbrB/MazE/SpoVT family DNA-binding domain-containing protein [Thermomicrobiales bacterium]|nr:AbrB/MazE/SpoVT family DNA-binding domain-containing protein [Thermomicrobiales bacterium]
MSVFSIQVDSKGRILVPDEARAEMDIHAGDVLVLRTDPVKGTLIYERVVEPLDRLALEAIAEFKAGQTVSLAAAEAELGLTVDGE